MATKAIVPVGSHVQHRAWHWIAKVLEAPEGELAHSTQIKVELPSGEIQTHALFSLIPDEHEFVYDWSEFDETSNRRAKGKSKRPKHKG